MKDWRNNTLEVGDLVIYPVRHASLLQMNEGEIVELLLDSTGEEKAKIKWLRNNRAYSMRTQPRRYKVVTVSVSNLTRVAG